jgi:hypothetical protein
MQIMIGYPYLTISLFISLSACWAPRAQLQQASQARGERSLAAFLMSQALAFFLHLPSLAECSVQATKLVVPACRESGSTWMQGTNRPLNVSRKIKNKASNTSI